MRSYGIQALVALQSVGITPDESKAHVAWIVTLEPDGPQPMNTAAAALSRVLDAVERGGRRAVTENFRQFLEIPSPGGSDVR